MPAPSSTPTPLEVEIDVARARSALLKWPAVAPGCHAGNPAKSPYTIVFDWDDTLLASTELSSNGYRLDSDAPLSPELETQMRQLEDAVVALLRLAIETGPTYIITNSEAGWVQLSCQKFLPAVLPLFSQITIMSARTAFEQRYPGSPCQWKLQAFLSIDLAGRHILSLGDSHVEREAVYAATCQVSDSRTKSVKFLDRPSLAQLKVQVNFVQQLFSQLVAHDGDLDLALTFTQLSC